MQEYQRSLVALLGSLVLALTLALSDVLRPMTAVDTLRFQVTLEATAFAYLPYVAREYPPPTATNCLTATPTDRPMPTVNPTATPEASVTVELTLYPSVIRQYPLLLATNCPTPIYTLTAKPTSSATVRTTLAPTNTPGRITPIVEDTPTP